MKKTKSVLELHNCTAAQRSVNKECVVGTFFLLHVLFRQMLAGSFAEHFDLWDARGGRSSARGPFFGSV